MEGIRCCQIAGSANDQEKTDKPQHQLLKRLYIPFRSTKSPRALDPRIVGAHERWLEMVCAAVVGPRIATRKYKFSMIKARNGQSAQCVKYSSSLVGVDMRSALPAGRTARRLTQCVKYFRCLVGADRRSALPGSDPGSKARRTTKPAFQRSWT